MICKNCGADLEENSKFCAHCGTKVESEVETNLGNEVVTENVNPIKSEEVGNVENNEIPVNSNVSYTNENTNTNANYNTERMNVTNVPTFSVVHPIILIVVCMCCCGGQLGAIFAVLSIYEGNKVEEYVRKNDIMSAKDALKRANNYMKVTYVFIAIGAAISLLYVFLNVITVLLG